MLSWLGAIPLMLASVVVLYLPGLATGYFLGLRRLWCWAFAPVFSIGAYAVLAIAMPWAGLPWTLGTAAIGAAVFSALIVLIGRLVLRARFSDPEERTTRWGWGAGSLAFAGAGLLFIGCVGIGDPNAVSQSWDSVFHHGALRYALDTANVSPFHLPSYSNPADTGSYYPGAWHAAVSLVALIGGSDIPLAINSFNMVVVALVWPASIMLLTRQLVRTTPTSSIAVGVLAAAFPAFPLNTLAYGILYPFFLGMAVLPAAVAAALQFVGLIRGERIAHLRLLGALALFGAGTVALSHPSAFTSLLVLCAVIAVVAFVANWRSATVAQRARRGALLILFLLVGYNIFIRFRTSWWWPAQTSLPEAVLQAFTSSILGAGLPLAMAALVVIGIVFAVMRRDRWGLAAALMWIVSAALYIITAGASDQSLRLIVNAWFADVPRLGAQLVVTVIPLAVFAVDSLSGVLTRSRLGRAGSGIITAVCLGSVLLTTGYPAFVPLLRLVHDGQSAAYIDAMPPDERRLLGGRAEEGRVPVNNVLSDDERALIARLPEHVPDGAVIAGSPWTGTSYAYALAGYPVLLSYQKSVPDEDAELILYSFAFEPDSPQVCDALQRTGVRFVLDFGTREVESGRHEYPGIENLDGNPAAELVDQQGEAKLFRITSCGLGG